MPDIPDAELDAATEAYVRERWPQVAEWLLEACRTGAGREQIQKMVDESRQHADAICDR